jgi:hypothetical protein
MAKFKYPRKRAAGTLFLRSIKPKLTGKFFSNLHRKLCDIQRIFTIHCAYIWSQISKSWLSANYEYARLRQNDVGRKIFRSSLWVPRKQRSFLVLRKIPVGRVFFGGTLLKFHRNFASVVRAEQLGVENYNAGGKFVWKVLPYPPKYTASYSTLPNLNPYHVVNPDSHRQWLWSPRRKLYQRESVFRHIQWLRVMFQISRNVLLFRARSHICMYLLQFAPQTYLSLRKNSWAIL